MEKKIKQKAGRKPLPERMKVQGFSVYLKPKEMEALGGKEGARRFFYACVSRQLKNMPLNKPMI